MCKTGGSGIIRGNRQQAYYISWQKINNNS